ncbi:MAG: GNAT family N-acetyltransferase [Geodermatophilaceae bacterium]|nr:GNAT family N-acetyltransferase [Geodermatophilaceae bacterium]
MVGEEDFSVTLAAVDEVVLGQLVHAAISDAAADEVTPPPTAGEAWTPTRVAWLRGFHRDRRPGLGGPAREATWAVVIGGRVVGSVRLKRTDEQGMLETGAWLTRPVRGRGVGRAAVAAVLDEAAALGASAVRADTTTTNAAALAVLERLGFSLTSAGDGRSVRALLLLEPQTPSTERR